MNCPVCGDKIPEGKSKCLRCGYECKEVATIRQDGNKDDTKSAGNSGEPEKEFREVSPDDVHMSGGSRNSHHGSILDDLFGGGIFGGFTSIFDGLFGFGNPFEDIDYEEYNGRDEDGFPVDVFDRDFVEVHDVETFDAEGNPKNDKKRSEEDVSHNRNSRHGNHGRKGRHGR